MRKLKHINLITLFDVYEDAENLSVFSLFFPPFIFFSLTQCFSLFFFLSFAYNNYCYNYYACSFRYLVLECCAGGELFDRISAKQHYSEKDAAFVLRQIFSGLNEMHKQKVTFSSKPVPVLLLLAIIFLFFILYQIAHCDLKPVKILFKMLQNC